MGLRYPGTVKKREFGQTDFADPLEGAYTPEIDFSKDTLAEQAPEATIVGGEEVKTPGAPMDMKSGAKGAATTLAQGGSATDAAASGLIMTGNPYAMAAGAGLMAYSHVQKKKEGQRKAEYDAKLKQAEERRTAITNLASIGQNLKA